MLFPSGKILHKDLSTNYTRSQKLISDLQEMRFTGYLHVSFWESDDYLLFDTGKIIQAYVRSGEDLDHGYKALSIVAEQLEQKDGMITVYILQPEIMTILSAIQPAKTVYRKTLEKQSAFSLLIEEALSSKEAGLLEFEFGKKQGSGAIYFASGKVVATVLKSRTGRTVTESDNNNLFKHFFKLVNSISTTVTQLQIDPVTAYEESEELQDWVYFYEFIYILNKVHKHFSSLLNGMCEDNLYYQFINESLNSLAADYGFDGLEITNGRLQNFSNNDVNQIRNLYFSVLNDTLAKMEDIKKVDRYCIKQALIPFCNKYRKPLDFYSISGEINKLTTGT